MAFEIEYPLGATPLSEEEKEGLIPKHMTHHAELNEWEQLNIYKGEEWAWSRNREILNLAYLKQLHERMFDRTWSWAGTFRHSDKNIGVDWTQISSRIYDLLNDVEYQMEHQSFGMVEIATRFHHRLVFIHPFPNGNGRHSRLMTDLLLHKMGLERFTWGRVNLVNPSDTRNEYIAALQEADRGDYQRLLNFVNS
ncbi:MAG: cell filamentation protein Fic [Betaproteobacteria bacterium HGW-Betaproteobacteria-2]|nr:MAG: cell filamentation protein Fic [Betaproteobacteria bacterium HGW-Betaproteobacteria-2]PKP58317.1 MAG: cell filamentation protein Fic [Candidatus Atribacteria bacterium HGW-Atribacteria-1]